MKEEFVTLEIGGRRQLSIDETERENVGRGQGRREKEIQRLTHR